jgi:4-methyl-5(b-hydroxyethyl)-thiazole monophosphate biosynthesis
VLAAHGLLDGKKATSYPSFQSKLPDVSEAKKRVVVDGNCITRCVGVKMRREALNIHWLCYMMATHDAVKVLALPWSFLW